MNLNKESCYRALVSHDARFDGVFFVGVSSTGIYCRTVCTAKSPKYENCTFFPSAAAAEQAGYRPCLRCRPELAPGNAPVDSSGRLAAAVAGRIEDGALADMSLATLAAELGVSDRHLRRVTIAEYGVTPVQLAQTQRLLLAKRLLTDTRMSVTEVAFASGFASLRRFNALFLSQYRMNPTDLRRRAGTSGRPDVLTFEIGFRPLLDWDSLMRFHAGHATAGVEWVTSERYARTARIGEHTGWLAVRRSDKRNTIIVDVSASLAKAVQPVLAGVKRLFDLRADPYQIDTHLGPLAAEHPGLRVAGAFDGFELTVRAILGQQVSIRAATTVAGRFVAAFGEPLADAPESLTHLFPTAPIVAALSPEDISILGMPRARGRTIKALAEAVASGYIVLKPGSDPEETIGRLLALPGVGDWTAQYVAMRALSWPDAFPHGDLGIAKAIGERRPKQVLEIAERWRPWRSYAAMHLWKSLEIKK